MSVTDDCARFGFRADLHRWRQLVSPAWLAALLAHEPVAAAPAHDWRLFEIGFGVVDAFLDAHIAGAAYIDTLQFESAPLWNKVSDHALLDLLLGHGIRHDTTVVLYGRNCLAAARGAPDAVRGCRDVRLLDGGFDAWRALALPVAQGRAREYPSAGDFGAHFPAHPEYLIDMHQARQLIEQGDGALVSVRTWNEFVGTTSGYSYIEAKGDIPGARWGRTRLVRMEPRPG